jgi:prophage antirepressor-like protein
MNSGNTQIQLDNKSSDNLMIKQFNGLNIQVYGTCDDPLFKAKDIGDLLEMRRSYKKF